MKQEILSQMAYRIIEFAGEINEMLRDEFIELGIDVENENEYLNAMLEYVEDIEKDPSDYLESLSLIDISDIGTFSEAIGELRSFIEDTLKIPLEERD